MASSLLRKSFFAKVTQVIQKVSAFRKFRDNIGLPICQTEWLDKAEDWNGWLAEIHRICFADLALFVSFETLSCFDILYGHLKPRKFMWCLPYDCADTHVKRLFDIVLTKRTVKPLRFQHLINYFLPLDPWVCEDYAKLSPARHREFDRVPGFLILLICCLLVFN